MSLPAALFGLLYIGRLSAVLWPDTANVFIYKGTQATSGQA